MGPFSPAGGASGRLTVTSCVAGRQHGAARGVLARLQPVRQASGEGRRQRARQEQGGRRRRSSSRPLTSDL